MFRYLYGKPVKNTEISDFMLRTRINICQWGQKDYLIFSLNSVNVSDTISRFFLKNIKSPNIDTLFRKQDIILVSFCILRKCDAIRTLI